MKAQNELIIDGFNSVMFVKDPSKHGIVITRLLPKKYKCLITGFSIVYPYTHRGDKNHKMFINKYFWHNFKFWIVKKLWPEAFNFRKEGRNK